MRWKECSLGSGGLVPNPGSQPATDGNDRPPLAPPALEQATEPELATRSSLLPGPGNSAETEGKASMPLNPEPADAAEPNLATPSLPSPPSPEPNLATPSLLSPPSPLPVPDSIEARGRANAPPRPGLDQTPETLPDLATPRVGSSPRAAERPSRLDSSESLPDLATDVPLSGLAKPGAASAGRVGFETDCTSEGVPKSSRTLDGVSNLYRTLDGLSKLYCTSDSVSKLGADRVCISGTLEADSAIAVAGAASSFASGEAPTGAALPGLASPDLAIWTVPCDVKEDARSHPEAAAGNSRARVGILKAEARMPRAPEGPTSCFMSPLAPSGLSRLTQHCPPAAPWSRGTPAGIPSLPSTIS
eukprot:jgi/Botrbrau1/3037/Bobra.0070s0033.1